jgi:hypothetical protein
MDLARIGMEWPLIEAEMALLDAEVAVVIGGDNDMARRRVRRAEARVLASARALAACRRPVSVPGEGPVAA